jgi:hypothetical protein
MVLSEELTSTEMSRPAVIEAAAQRGHRQHDLQSAAGWPAPRARAAARPATPISTSTTAWTALITPSTATLNPD